MEDKKRLKEFTIQELEEKKFEIKLTYIMEVVGIIFLLSFLINRVIEDFTVKGIIVMPSFFVITGVMTTYFLIKSITESYLDKKVVYKLWIETIKGDGDR